MEQTQDLLGGNDENAEHLMGVHLGSAAHPYMASAVVALQQTVDPLRLGACFVALGLVRGKFDLLPPSCVVVDQRDVPLLAGPLTYNPTAIGRVDQIVEVGDPLTGQAHQRDRRLAIMHGGGGQDRRYGDVTVRGVDRQLVAGPGLLEYLAIFLAAHVAGGGELRQALRHALTHLQLNDGQLLGPFLAFARAPAFLGRRRYRLGGRRCRINRGHRKKSSRGGRGGHRHLGGGLLPRLDLGRIPGDVPYDLVAQLGADQRLVDPHGQRQGGEFRKHAREARGIRDGVKPLKAADPPQRLIRLEAVDQGLGGRQVKHRLGD